MASPLDPRLVPRAAPGLQALALPGGRLLLRHGRGVSLVGGVTLTELDRVLRAVDGRRTAGAIAEELAADHDRRAVLRLLGLLAGDALLPHDEPAASPTDAQPPRAPGDTGPLPEVLVVGNGAAGSAVARHLRSSLSAAVALLTPAEGDAGEDAAFEARRRDSLLTLPQAPSRNRPAVPLEGVEREALPLGDPAAFGARLRRAGLVVVALEGVPYRLLFRLQEAAREAGTPALFALPEPDGIALGPTSVPAHTPCLACALAARFRFLGRPVPELLSALELLPTTGVATEEAFAGAAEILGREARQVLADDGAPRLLAAVDLLRPDGDSTHLPVARIAGCPICSAGSASSAGAGALPTPLSPRTSALVARGEAELAEVLDRRPPRIVVEQRDRRRRVGIVGGGTAGYLAALALSRADPALAVTLVESKEVPVIGVGEATTPLLPQFLHVDLGLDVHELFELVRPTLKLGIRFLWGAPEGRGFQYPFGPLHLLEPHVYDDDLAACSLRSLLMWADAVPVGRTGERWVSRLGTEVGYHLENRRFVGYLREKARQAGVERLEATVERVETDADRRRVEGLVTRDGRRLAFDLYVDCTGFRSLLLGEALGSPFRGYEASLFTDRAVVASVPHGGRLKPYTVAETMDAGWCWTTPQREADHRGYVFSSAFLDEDGAVAEMRSKNPGMGEPRTVRFRPGRREHFVRGNVVALGNAYGFVEPLESTALHLLVRQIALLVDALPLGPAGIDPGAAPLLDRRAGSFWDYVAWFLALHFRFNRRLATPFWKACRRQVDVSRHGELLEAFRARGPLSCQRLAASTFDYPDPLWGPAGIDVLLLGQGVPCHAPRPLESADEWRERRRLQGSVAVRAVSQEEALRAADEQPALLDAFVGAFRRTGPVSAVVARGGRPFR